MDPRIKKFAEILVDYSTRIEPGDKVLLSGEAHAEPLIKAVYQLILERGGHPFTRISLPGMLPLFYKYASEAELNRTCNVLTHIYETFDALIAIRGDANTRELTNVPGEKIQKVSTSRRPLTKIVMDRSAKWSNDTSQKKGQMRWVVTEFPVDSLAIEAGLSTMEFEDFVYGAVGALYEDPVAHWEEFSKKQAKFCEFLNGRPVVEFESPNCNITFDVSGRKWINCDGRLNMPDGEIFTSPVENGVNGWVSFTYPTLYQGTEVDGVRVEMKEGRCVKATATKGEKFLNDMLDTDPDCRILGELAIGTNPNITKFTKSILFDEKINKSFHMAFGSGYPESGSKNEEAAIHWDMICDMSDGEMWAGGIKFYENGKFLI